MSERGLGISAVSIAELAEGVHYAQDPARAAEGLRNFLRQVSFIGIDEGTCTLFGKERGRLRRAGTLVADFDLLIGVTACQHGLTLLTNNRRHFEKIEGLRIESLA